MKADLEFSGSRNDFELVSSLPPPRGSGPGVCHGSWLFLILFILKTFCLVHKTLRLGMYFL